MKRIAAFATVFLFALAGLAAQDQHAGVSAYAGTVELRASITDFTALVTEGDAALQARSKGKAFLMLGSLAKPIVRDDSDFTAVAEFSEGRWIGTSSIELFRVYLEYRGDDYRFLLTVPVGTRAIALVDKPAIFRGPDGEAAVIFQVLSITVLN